MIRVIIRRKETKQHVVNIRTSGECLAMRITQKMLRQIIREELHRSIREADEVQSSMTSHPTDSTQGSGLRAAAQKGKKALLTSELTKTYMWFKNFVFPAVEENKWPIIADRDYMFFFNRRDGDINSLRPGDKNFFYVKKGTSYKSLTDSQTFYAGDPSAGGQPHEVKHTLEDVYEALTDLTLGTYDIDLNVPMESFPS